MVVTAIMAVDLGQAARPGLALLLVIPAGLSLGWRLRAPLVPLLLICLTNLVLMATAPGQFGPQTIVFGVLVALYTAAAQLRGRTALVVGGLSLAALWVAHVLTKEGDLGDFLPFVVWGVPWLAGRLVRRQALTARAAGARAALLEVEAREATGRERDRIARELHDVVGHAVSLMVVQAGAERMALGDTAPRTTAALLAVEASGRQALVELRAMLGVLRATGSGHELAPQPDLGGVPALVEAVRTAGLEVQVSVTGDPQAVSAGVGLAGYRVVQEALTNALRHGAGTAQVQVRVGDAVEVEVRNGLGHGVPVGAGRGLTGMRERVELFGGTLSAGPVDGEWVVAARLPTARVAAP